MSTHHLTTLAKYASAPEVHRIAELVQRYIGKPNITVWAGSIAKFTWDQASPATHIMLMGIRGYPAMTPHPLGEGRADAAFAYIAEAVGSRRESPISIDDDDALRIVKVLNHVAAPTFPAPDLLALAGWSHLHEMVVTHRGTGKGWEFPALHEVIARRAARTCRLDRVRDAFLAASAEDQFRTPA